MQLTDARGSGSIPHFCSSGKAPTREGGNHAPIAKNARHALPRARVPHAQCPPPVTHKLVPNHGQPIHVAPVLELPPLPLPMHLLLRELEGEGNR